MKVSFQNNVLGLSAETPAEEEICALLCAADGHVFKLQARSARGLAFHALGPEDDARRAPLNINRSMEPRFAPISNLAPTPFVLDGEWYASVEGFWQGLKLVDPAQRGAFAQLSGAHAKDAGSRAGQPPTFNYRGATITTGSPEHWALMRRACEAKFAQHQGARAALHATGERWLTHRVRKDSRTIPGVVMADIWMRIRAGLQELPER